MFKGMNKEIFNSINKVSQLAQPSWIIVRKPENYQLFLDLYERVGYAADEPDIEAWRKKNIQAWSKQDELLPGTCTGGLYDGRLVCSLGTLPISNTIAYGHSFCMEKELPSLLMMLPQIVHSTNMLNYFQNVHYYAGSYKNDSRLTSQLHTINPVATTQQLKVQSIDLSPVAANGSPINLAYQLEECDIDYASLSGPLAKLLELFDKPHTALENVHQIKHFKVSSSLDSAPKALVLYHNSQSGFTAIDLFKRSWIILLDDGIDGADICEFLRSHSQFANQTFELVNCDFSISPKYTGPDIAVPRYWVFTPKELVPKSLPTVLGSIIKIIINKYKGDDILAACQKLIDKAFLLPVVQGINLAEPPVTNSLRAKL